LLDWIVREGGVVLTWWALVSLAGLAVFPLLARVLGALPDRGYTLARAAGLLFVGYVFWLLANFGFLRNTPGDMIFAWGIVAAFSLAVYLRGERLDWRVWWRENRSAVITTEILFVLLLFGWALYRANYPTLGETEKPMELMFMNAIQRSPTFPPNDAWMSGYAISYYYFGYVIAAMLATLSGVPATMGFSVMIATLLGLTGIGAFGVVYNLVRARGLTISRHVHTLSQSARPAVLAGLLGVLLVAFVGNFHLPLVEIPYQTGTGSADYLAFWDVNNRDTPQAFVESDVQPLDPATWTGRGHWWWFRSARVVQDLDLNNGHIEVIDEFPAFSFLLADVHPHVLALPFAFLALGAALNLLLKGRRPRSGDILFYGFLIGSFGFMNTWDAPVYLLVFLGADALRRLLRNRSGRLTRDDFVSLILLGVALVVLMLAFFLPFWLGFRSQAGGILPNILNPTKTPQLFLMFGPFFLLLTPFLLVEAWRGGRQMNWSLGIFLAVALLALLVLAMLGLIGAGMLIPQLRSSALEAIESAGGFSAVLPILGERRLLTLLTSLGLTVGVALVLGRLLPSLESDGKRKSDTPDPDDATPYPLSTGFALLLIGVGLFLVLVPEYVYLRDNFGTRMNMVFKFYYQAWVLWSIGAAYGAYSLLADVRLRLPGAAVQAAYGALLALVLVLGLLFPLVGVYTRGGVESGRVFAETPRPLSLDGGPAYASNNDYQAIMCLDRLVQWDDAVVAEAIGPSYRAEYGRVAALTGIPTVLGWEGHEGQWRGSTYPAIAGSRNPDIRSLYSDPRWDVAQTVIDRYGIDYVFFGDSERNQYGTGGEAKFRDALEAVCEFGDSRFYRVTPSASAALVDG
jgi:YYY domain-containing protein